MNTDIASGVAHGSGLINDNADAADTAHNNINTAIASGIA